MTLQHENRVILVGTLINIGRRNRQAVIERRNSLGASIDEFGLEIISPFGDPFVVNLDATISTKGADLLNQTMIDKPLVVEGMIRRVVHRDRRLSVTDSDIGARMVETQIKVSLIRQPREEEVEVLGAATGSTAAWLTGKIIAEPRFTTHPMLRDVDIARTILQVTLQRPSPYPGSRATTTEQMDVLVALPTKAEGSAFLYKPGNVVLIEGQVDLTRVPQGRNTIVQSKVEALEKEWQEQRMALEQSIKAPRERERQIRMALSRHRNRVASVSDIPILTVVAGYVELLEGTALSEKDINAILKREYARRRQQRTQRAGQGRAPNEPMVGTATPEPATEPEETPPPAGIPGVPAASMIEERVTTTPATAHAGAANGEGEPFPQPIGEPSNAPVVPYRRRLSRGPVTTNGMVATEAE